MEIMNTFKNTLLLILALSCGQLLHAQTIEVATPSIKNQIRFGGGYVAMGNGDLRGVQLYGQYMYQLSNRFGISLEANVSHGSALSTIDYNADKNYSVLTKITESPYNSYANHNVGGTQYDPHLNRTTHLIGAVNLNYYILDRSRTKLKAAAGFAYTYMDRNSTAEVRTVQVTDNPDLIEWEELVLITPVYERLSDWGWNIQLDYEYHFSNRMFTSLGVVMHNFFSTGDDISSVRFGVGVNF